MNNPPGGTTPGAGPMASGPSSPPTSPQGGQAAEDSVLQAQAKILTEALRQLLPKQSTTAIGAQPICVKVLPNDTGRTSVVMVHNPVKDGLTSLTGQHAETDPTTAHNTARLLHEQLGMCYGPDAVEHIVTSHVGKAGVVTQVFVLSQPLNILRQQYRTGLNAQRAIDAAIASRDLASNPRVRADHA